MKKIISLALAVLMIVSMAALFSSCSKKARLDKLRRELEGKLEADYSNDLEGTTLYVYNWGEYISNGKEGALDINLAFEAVTGIHVEYSTYDSNESMYATLSGGGVNYDVVIPSDYMIGRLIEEGYLAKIDTSKLSNFKYIDEQYRNPEYDPTGEYSVPYAGGYLGVIYNNTMVDPEDVDGTWSLCWNQKYQGQILGIDNARDALATAMFALGIDVNTSDTAEWDRAAEYLKKAVPLYQSWAMDQNFEKMEGENAAVCVYYTGDYPTMVDDMDEASGNGDHLSMYYPEEGTNVFFDACCILKGSQNYDAAMLYLNFLMDPYVALQNAAYIHYVCPNTAVTENPEYSEYHNEILYPKTEVKSQYYTHLDEATIKHYEDLWNKIKSAG